MKSQTPRISRAHHHHPPLTLLPSATTSFSSPGATPPLHGPRVSAPPHRSLPLYSPPSSLPRPLPHSLAFATSRASRIASVRGEWSVEQFLVFFWQPSRSVAVISFHLGLLRFGVRLGLVVLVGEWLVEFELFGGVFYTYVCR